MRKTKKSLLSRIAVLAISIFIIVSCLPNNVLEAFGAELAEFTTESENGLEYRTISTSPDDSQGEVITLNGMMPSAAEVNVEKSEEYSSEKLCAYNISITDNDGSDFQPESDSPINVKITNSVIGQAASKEQKLRLWHINENGIREEIKNFTIKNDSIIFEAKGFSVYEVDNGDPPLRTYHFQMPEDPSTNTGYKDYYFPTEGKVDSSSDNYKMICQQIIKNGEKPIFPQLPADVDSRYTFIGWYVYNTVEDKLEDEPFDFENIDAVVQNEEVILRAVFKSCVFVIFYDQFNGKSQKFPVMATRRGALENADEFAVGNVIPKDIYDQQTDKLAKVSYKGLTVTYDDENQQEGEPPQMAFMGWALIPQQASSYINAHSDEDELTELEIKEYLESNNVQIITSDTKDILISETTRLYPVFEPIRWLEFNTNQDSPNENANHYQGATYKPPIYFSSEKGFSFDDPVPSTNDVQLPPAPPILAGYTFDGWFTSDGKRVTNSAQELIPPQNTTPDANGMLHYNDKLGYKAADNRLYFIDPDANNKTVQVDLYAHWTPADSKYTIVIWKQKATDAAGLAPKDKEWDFERSIVLNAQTGTNVSVANEYKNYSGRTITVTENGVQKTYDFKGFSYDTDRNALETSPVTVRGDGKTVLNVYYSRKAHTFTFRRNNRTIRTVTRLYGSNISDIWEFTASGQSYPVPGNNTTSWQPTNSSTYTARITQMLLMPDEDISFNYQSTSYDKKQFHYYVETLPDDEGTRVYNNRRFVPYNDDFETVDHDFQIVVYNDDFFELEGFTRLSIATPDGTDRTNTIRNAGRTGVTWENLGSSELYFYYTRNKYNIDFIDAFNNQPLSTASIYFDQKTQDFVTVPDVEHEGYEFSGWYADEACSTPIAFTDADYEKYSRIKAEKEAQGQSYQFQDYRRMPSHNLQVYAGWETLWFKIEIDPNGGQLSGSQATWFWEPYNGDPIEEYKTATRNYEPDVNGEYYYTLRNRAYYGLGEEWVAEEDTTYKNQIVDGYCTRGAFYSTDISLATDVKRYKEASEAYRYLGWYEVDPITGEEKPFNFGTRVIKNTYLKLHWKQLGTYFINYNAGEGTIDGQDSNEKTFEFLDADDYTDHADIVVTRVAKAPSGMNFIGWKIRNDSSETIYYPGQSFHFSSDYAVTTSEIIGDQIETKRIIYLDAVYKKIENAKIIYDPNGGVVDVNALSHAGGQDPDRYPTIITSGTDYPITPEYKIENNKLIVSDLMNNSAVRLADGIGFTNAGYTFIGWSTTPNGENGTFFKSDSINCYVDTKEPLVLYAQWELRVYFDRNNVNSPDNTIGWGGDWTTNTDHNYVYDPVKHQYYTTIVLGTKVNNPEYILASSDSDEMFRYWSAEKQTSIGVMKTPFDFDTVITEDIVDSSGTFYTNESGETKRSLTLYGCWNAPIRIPLHIVDTTEETWVKHDDWLQEGVTDIILRNDVISLDQATVESNYVDTSKTTGKIYEFACVAGNGNDDYLNISYDRKIKSIFYDAEEMKVKVVYDDDSEHEFSTSNTDPDAVYLVYFKSPQDVPIGYKSMSVEGTLSDVSPLNNAAPRVANVSKDGYDMKADVTLPLNWANKTDGFYSYAIGSKNATSVSDLKVITNYSTLDSDRPTLDVRNTWHGFEYSTDGGTTWNTCGYDIQLYVIYYEQRPTIVNLTEKTIGLTEDMSEEFDYTVRIIQTKTETITRTYYNSWMNPTSAQSSFPQLNQSPVTTSQEVNPQTFSLSDSESRSFVLFSRQTADTGEVNDFSYHGWTYHYIDTTTTEDSQTIVIDQSPKADYTTSNDAASGDHEYNSSYSSTEEDAVTITYTNTHKLKNQIHLAISQNGVLTQTDTLRTSDANIYEHTFASAGDTWNLSTVDPATFITDNSGRYVFQGIIKGSEDSENNITLGMTDVSNLTFGSIGNEKYGYYVNGNNAQLLGNDNIYLVYFELPTIKYMFENPKTGELTMIDPLQKNGTDFLRNGNTIAQNEILPVPSTGNLLVSQISTPGAPAFLIPDLLDLNGKYSALDLEEIAVKTSDGSMNSSDSEMIRLYISNGKLQYKFTETDALQPFADDLTVYAIYKVRGYKLTLTKDIIGDASDSSDNYTVTIHSDVLGDGEYYISGYGSADTIDSVNHEITITLHRGSIVTIYGLPQGDYTVSEAMKGDYTMTAMVNGEEVVVNQNRAAVRLDRDTTIDIVNAFPIPPTGAGEAAAPYLIIVVILIASAAAMLILRRKEGKNYDASPI